MKGKRYTEQQILEILGQLGPPPGSLRWLAKGLDRKVLVHLAALLRRA